MGAPRLAVTTYKKKVVMPIPVMCHDGLLFISGISATAVLRL